MAHGLQAINEILLHVTAGLDVHILTHLRFAGGRNRKFRSERPTKSKISDLRTVLVYHQLNAKTPCGLSAFDKSLTVAKKNDSRITICRTKR